ncbi:MAG TPA: M48 family metalloprotease [Longimicrobium sp.]
MSNAKVFLLMAGLTGLFVALGGWIGGQAGMLVAAGMAAVMNLVMYVGSAQMVLRMYGARVVGRDDAPWLYDMTDLLRLRAELPMPVLAIAPHAQPNAFATGRSPRHAVVCVTQGLIDTLSFDEMEGVIAHELAHIKNRDMLLQTLTATLAGAISNLASFGLFFGGGGDEEEGGHPLALLGMAVVAPLAAMLIQFAISRQREFKADAVGAEICGRPLALAGALRRLEAGARQVPLQVSPAAAPLAMVNPLAAVRGGRMLRWFATHPPTEERVARLQALASAHAGRRPRRLLPV